MRSLADRLHQQMMECERLKEEYSFALGKTEEGSELEAALCELLEETINIGLIAMTALDAIAGQN